MIVKDERARNWSFILYPESAPEDWKDILDEYHVKTVVSPVHDLDCDKYGEVKKPHHHIIVMFDGKKAYSQMVKMYTDKLSCTIPQKVASARGMVRYFCHLDNPEKAQYEIDDIICFGGVDAKKMIEYGDSDKYVILQQIGAFIGEKGIQEYCELWDYALENNMETWIPILADYAYCLNTLVRSKRYSECD